MQKGSRLHFDCQGCQQPIHFSIFDLDQKPLICPRCQKEYLFSDEILKRQLKKFEALCQQLLESEEILSMTSVGIKLGHQEVKIPYKLLLTRFNSILDLKIGDQAVAIRFHFEPSLDNLDTKEKL